MLTFKEDIKDTQIYLGLRKKVGWIELNPVQAQRALDNSMKIITVYDDDKPIGMGRIVGDGAVICYIQDLIIIPDSRMMLCLMCAKGREEFYTKHGFIARPTSELGPGMIQYILK